MSEYGDIVIVSEKLDENMDLRPCTLRSKHYLDITDKVLSPDDINNMLTLGVMVYLLATKKDRFLVTDEDSDVLEIVKQLKELRKSI